MNQCRDCKWWGNGGEYQEGASRHCMLFTPNSEKWGLGWGEVPSNAMAAACSDEAAEFWTSPDFGCIQWEACNADTE